MLQNFARRHGHPIDAVAFEHLVMDFGPPGGQWEAPEDGCYVRGLFLEGARWDAEAHALGGPARMCGALAGGWRAGV